MLGEVINRSLMMLLGYVYPAFECFKTMERNRVEIDQLRFWCQYWVIVALLTALERVGDVFISWLPMYGEMKLAFIIYLWYPRTMGTSYVYETFLRPFMTRYEPDLDQNMGELRRRAWNLAVMHWHNVANFGETTFAQFLQYLTSKAKGSEAPKIDPQYPSAPPLNSMPSAPPLSSMASSHRPPLRQPGRNRSPSTSPPPAYRAWFPQMGSNTSSESGYRQDATTIHQTAMDETLRRRPR
ncbi:PREDICTED: putative HVA22-like protein g [Nelumbo nucifera]|uniref:HVA22-like protein n=2 Tax=Nelumbo nucifera TaxID=4432 RepID=A0A1U7Z0N2_NELNU|nr:PREDICTED: putative HVA22-like protein g [Nelumbo nucifera]DAD48426.1 TPA_asm: hypothetical protein HUJ06_018363 [Nelumbo nucifera]